MWSTLITIFLTRLVFVNGFSYDNQTAWKKEHTKCKGNYQSPIRLDRKTAIIIGKVPEIAFLNYNTVIGGDRVDVLNNGNTIRISFDQVDNSKKPMVKDGPLGRDQFVMEDIHFHWGSFPTRGTEHKLDGVSYSLEAHLVHRNVKYESFEDAKGKENGIVVLAVPFKEKSEGVSTLSGVVNLLEKVKFTGNETTFHGNFVLDKMFYLKKEKLYFMYEGSLTTPVCDEKVLWIVYSKARCVLKSEMFKFRSLKRIDGEPLINNFRKPQKPNGRKVILVV
ncbi:CA14 family protein [Megaselia abdita]